jgi:hypothetical protein
MAELTMVDVLSWEDDNIAGFNWTWRNHPPGAAGLALHARA